MNYKKQLFQIERWSPRLAKKIWGLSTFFDSPMSLALGPKITHFSDTEIEVQLPAPMILAGAEFASRLLWQRQLESGIYSIFLKAVKADFLKEPLSFVAARAELRESDREDVLRKLHGDQQITHEMSVTLIDHKKQNLGSVNCTWQFKRLKPQALQGGN